MKQIPELETPRLILRGHVESDFDASAAMWADPAVVRYISGKPFSREEAWSRFLRYTGHWQVRGYGYWVVEKKDSREFLGEVGFADYKRAIDPPLDGKPDAGWVFTAAAQGKGYAFEAVQSMTRWADSSLECESTVCIVQPEHLSSVGLARKAGYRQSHTAIYMGESTLVMERHRSRK